MKKKGNKIESTLKGLIRYALSGIRYAVMRDLSIFRPAVVKKIIAILYAKIFIPVAGR